jgi:hypothetical protein
VKFKRNFLIEREKVKEIPVRRAMYSPEMI